MRKILGFGFCEIDDVNKVLYTIYIRHTEYYKARKGGWTVLADPSDYDGTDLDCLGPFKINEDTLIYLIKKTEQPTANILHLLYRIGNNNASESEKDDQYGQVT